MKLFSTKDVFLNIALPVLAGSLIYLSHHAGYTFPFIKNYLPDALWAYAFASAILIIWQREINKAWLAFLFVIAAGYELFQYNGIIPGTGDWWDMAVYSLSFSAAIFLNLFFKHTFQNHYSCKANP